MTNSSLVVEAFAATFLFIVELLLRVCCILLHFLRWRASKSHVECMLASHRCDDIDRRLLNHIANSSDINNTSKGRSRMLAFFQRLNQSNDTTEQCETKATKTKKPKPKGNLQGLFIRRQINYKRGIGYGLGISKFHILIF